jgi:hypothetical protein
MSESDRPTPPPAGAAVARTTEDSGLQDVPEQAHEPRVPGGQRTPFGVRLPFAVGVGSARRVLGEDGAAEVLGSIEESERRHAQGVLRVLGRSALGY